MITHVFKKKNNVKDSGLGMQATIVQAQEVEREWKMLQSKV